MKRLILLFLALAAPAAAQSTAVDLPTEATRGWAILVDGRVKPIDTWARETALAITGRESFDGLDALDILWGYCLAPREFRARPYLRVDSKLLKSRLGLDSGRKRYSFDELMGNAEFRGLVEGATKRKREKADLSPLDKDGLGVYAKLETLDGLMRGASLTIVPVGGGRQGWSAPTSLKDSERPELRSIFAGFAALSAAYRGHDAKAFEAAAAKLTQDLRAARPDAYPDPGALDRELFYNDFSPFGKAWLLYLLGFFALLLFDFKRRVAYGIGLGLIAGGFACHTLGIALRWMIAGRAPVSDMYESLVFLGWGAIAIGMIMELVYRSRYFALSAGLMGFLSLAFAEHLPLDSSINPLVPVLAHTSWLSIHVMTIMLAYSSFALTLGLGHVVVAIQLFRPGKTSVLRDLSSLLYKCLQVGVLFLAAGIAFGAIWANESWGRYWGWDPKETWSLITFFIYLAIIHARFAGWLHNFGLAVCSILAFLSVVMTYYGVNFILGAGLHSYGFSSGGALWVALYLAIEVAVIVTAAVRYRSAVASARAARTAS